MNLTDAKKLASPRKNRKRCGRGRASGIGKTCGYGHNGQRSRSGDHGVSLYEGGQMPLFRRLSKRGFNNLKFNARPSVVNVGDLNTFDDGQEVDAALMASRGLVTKLDSGVKVLGNGELTQRLTVKANGFSKRAVAKIEAAGGTAVTL